MTGALVPAPGAAPRHRMLLAQAGMELRLTLRNGEQLLLTLIIPLLLLAILVFTPFVPVDGPRVEVFVPGIVALAIMSTAFTGQAIATGFERKYGVLKRLGATALPRSVLLGGKTLAVIGVEMIQLVLILGAGLLLGWHGHPAPVGVLLLVALGTAAFSGLGLLMAGTLRAEVTLAAANLVWFVLLFFGGAVFPLARFPAAVARLLELLPTAALADGLRVALEAGGMLPGRDLAVLASWAVVGLGLAAAKFRWE
ncbi:MAG TPA: ABC transporter permease [Mycobacteriales bacterium]|nr:ABC transporter permease [Mycobacteriales bacterium]